MKRLILVRHSKAEDMQSHHDDRDRNLKPKGNKDARLIAEKLLEESVHPQLMISSPARRAAQTAAIMADSFGYQKNNIVYHDFLYEGYTSGEFVTFINKQSNDIDEIIVVGHNPEIAMLAINLTGGNFFHFPTTATVVIRFNTDSWEEVNSRQGKTEMFLYPKMLKGGNDD
jgi:phosphohistidine phosphatase